MVTIGLFMHQSLERNHINIYLLYQLSAMTSRHIIKPIRILSIYRLDRILRTGSQKRKEMATVYFECIDYIVDFAEHTSFLLELQLVV